MQLGSSTRQRPNTGAVTIRRRPGNPTATQTVLELKGVEVHFPFQPCPCQTAHMEKVLDALSRGENALLESPTGTGKTLCLLCATLAWQRHQVKSLNQSQTIPSQQPMEEPPRPVSGAPVVVHASRTHSQLSQVVRELRATCHRPLHAVLGSREQFCVNPKVNNDKAAGVDVNTKCNKMCKDRKCGFRLGVDNRLAQDQEIIAGGGLQPVMDLEDLTAMGKAARICPFCCTRGQAAEAELLFLPHNYLFDRTVRETTLSEVNWEDAVVVFDEVSLNCENAFGKGTTVGALAFVNGVGLRRTIWSLLPVIPCRSIFPFGIWTVASEKPNLPENVS